MLGDIVYTIRTFRREPWLPAVVCLTLAVGIGINTAVFGLVDRLMLRGPDQVRDADQLYRIPASDNYVTYLHLTKADTSVDVAAFVPIAWSARLAGQGFPIAIHCSTWTYFPVLGTQLQLGRSFAESEDVPGGPALVVISDEFWSTRLERDPSVVGRTLHMAGKMYTVIGVAPRGFRGVEMEPVDGWVSLAAANGACSFTGASLFSSSRASWLTTIGRLRPGVVLPDAEAQVAWALRAMGRYELQVPGLLTPLRREPGRDGQVARWLALGSFSVLMIACLNVGGLLLIRALTRRPEIAVRFHLGAGRCRIVRQLLVEHTLLTLVGVVGALGAAAMCTRLLAAYFPFVSTHALLDGRVLLGMSGLAIACAVLSGAIPAIEVMRSSGRFVRAASHVTVGGMRARSALITAQATFAFVLVVGAGLFIQSVTRVMSDSGVDLDRVVVVIPEFERAGYRRDAENQSFFEFLMSRVQHLPDVETVAFSSGSLLGSRGASLLLPIRASEKSADATDGMFHLVTGVSVDYFRAIGTSILRGRSFAASDDVIGKRVAIVDQHLASALWPGQNAVGRCLWVGQNECWEVVGVTRARRAISIGRETTEVFVPFAQVSGLALRPQMLLIRTSTQARQSTARLGTAIRGLVPDLPFIRIIPLADLADHQARSWRLGATFFGLFAAIATLLAGVGVYVSSAFAVRLRTAEFGIRMALGAGPREIRRFVIWQGMLPIFTASMIGMVAAYWGSRYVQSLLFQVQSTDAAALFTAWLVLALAAFIGCAIPAKRAAAIDPAQALRQS